MKKIQVLRIDTCSYLFYNIKSKKSKKKGYKMKYVLKNIDDSTNDVKPYILRANKELKPYLADCAEFDGKILEPIQISNYQKDFLNSFGRTFWIVSYLPPSVIRSLLPNLDGLTHFAFCVHDRDRNEDGTLKVTYSHSNVFRGACFFVLCCFLVSYA